MNRYKTKVATSVVLLLHLMSCAHPSHQWVLSEACEAPANHSQHQYRVKVKQSDVDAMQFLVANNWNDGALTSVGINPLGIKLYSATWQQGRLNMNVNPLYKKMNFHAVLQGLLLSSFLTSNNVSCIQNTNLQHTHEKTNVIFALKGEKIATFFNYSAKEKNKKFEWYSNNYTVNFTEI